MDMYAHFSDFINRAEKSAEETRRMIRPFVGDSHSQNMKLYGNNSFVALAK